MSRKMFNKSRPARDALNKAGGIMDSSSELMQEVQGYPVQGVQNFANGSNVRIPGRSIYAEEGPNDGTIRRFLKDTFQQRMDPNYNVKPLPGSFSYVPPDQLIPASPPEYDLNMPAFDERGVSTGFDEFGNVITNAPRQTFEMDFNNPTDLSESGIASQLAIDKAAIEKFQAANAPDAAPQYVPGTQQPFGRDQLRSIETISEILAKQSANPDLVRAEGSEGFEPKMDPVLERAKTLQGTYDGLGTDEALKLAQQQLNAEAEKRKETDFVAKIAEDTEAEKFEKLRREQPSESQQRELEIAQAYKDDQTEAFERARRASTSDSEVVDALTTGTDLVQLKQNITDVVRNGTPDMQRASLDALINEFKDRTPKYDGQNMSLAIAKIGFAIAAGQSPNAMTNIANGLSQGVDSIIKDKAKKDEFNRQIELSALQYGLGEQSKYRAEDRTIKRADLTFNRQIELADRKLNYFVADTAGVGENGQKFIKGDQVGVTDGYIRNNGVPSGLTTENLVKATAVRAAATAKFLQEQKAKKIITNKDYLSLSKRVDDAELRFTKSRNLQTLVEGQIFNVTDGKVTGITAGATKLMNKAANAVKIDLGAAYETPAEYDRAMQKVANSMIQEILGEGSKNLSNVDRQLASEIVGLFANDWKGQIFADKDVQLSRLQGVLSDMQRSEQASLKELSDITALVSGQTLPSGQQVTFGKTQSVFEAIDGGFEVKPLEGTWSFDTEDNVLRMK